MYSIEASFRFLFFSKGSKEGKKLVITLESSFSEQPNRDLVHIVNRTNQKQRISNVKQEKQKLEERIETHSVEKEIENRRVVDGFDLVSCPIVSRTFAYRSLGLHRSSGRSRIRSRRRRRRRRMQ